MGFLMTIGAATLLGVLLLLIVWRLAVLLAVTLLTLILGLCIGLPVVLFLKKKGRKL